MCAATQATGGNFIIRPFSSTPPFYLHGNLLCDLLAKGTALRKAGCLAKRVSERGCPPLTRTVGMCDSCTVAGDYLSGAHSRLCVAGRKEAKGRISRDSRCNFRRARERPPEQTKASAFSIRSSEEVSHKDAFPCRLTQPPPPAVNFLQS